MNELIEELYKQSFIEVQDENSFPCMTFSKQKFAELIVQECLAKAEEEAELYRGFSHLGGAAEYAKVMHNYQLLLKEHFGVER
jgi:hypothetical protein